MWAITQEQFSELGLSGEFDSNGGYISLIDICNNNGIKTALWATRYLDNNHDNDLWEYGNWCTDRVKELLIREQLNRKNGIPSLFSFDENIIDELIKTRNDVYNNTFLHVLSNTYNFGEAVNKGIYAAVYSTSFVVDNIVQLDQPVMFIKMCEGNAPWQQK